MTTFGGGSIASCRVRCIYKNSADVALSGNVSFTPTPAYMADIEAQTIYYPTPRAAVLNSSGLIDINLFATDDPDLNPWNFTYTVVENLLDGTTPYTNTYSIKAPSNGDIWLSSVVPVASSQGQQILRGPAPSSYESLAYVIALGGN